MDMNRAVTNIRRDTCLVAVSINGVELYAKIVPSRGTVLRVERDEMPPHMLSPMPQEQAHDEAPAPPTEAPAQVPQEQPELGIGKTLLGAAALAKSHLGIGAASDDVVQARYKECLSCKQNDLGRCVKCGCYLWSKVRQAKERCPIGRW